MTKRKFGYQVWCDDCSCRFSEEISWWMEHCRAVTRTGRLRVEVECDVCEAVIAIGEQGTALTFVYGEPEGYTPWEDGVLEFDEQTVEA